MSAKAARCRSSLRAAALVAALTSHASAAPQWNLGVESGVCSNGHALGLQGLGWCNALHADVLLLRQRSSEWGVGPALRVGTASFADLRLDAGLSLLVPTSESFPLVLEAGPHLRNFSEPGVFAGAFFGFRSFNHYGSYESATGLSVSAERSFTAGTPSALWISARIDGLWLALPFLLAYNALR